MVAEFLTRFFSNTAYIALWLGLITPIYLIISAAGHWILPFVGRCENKFEDSKGFIFGILLIGVITLIITYIMIFLPGFVIIFPYITWIAIPLIVWANRSHVMRWIHSSRYYVFVLSYLFLMVFQFGILEDLEPSTPANNFILGLPIDFQIPLMFAESLRDGNILIFGEWLGSDRPPLFSGFILMFSAPFVRLTESYLFVGTGLQLLIVPIMMAVTADVVGHKKMKFAAIIPIVALVFSPLFIHNISFLWPKIFSAIFQLIAVYLIFYRQIQRRADVLLASAALALAFLSHGGSGFAIVGIGLLYIFLNLRPIALLRGVSIFIGFLILSVPWMLYQKLIQPPGDRLLKWQLFGQIPITEKGLFEVAAEAYHDFELIDLWLRMSTSFYNQILMPYQSLHGDWFSIDFLKNFTIGSFFYTTLSIGAFTIPIMLILAVVAQNKNIWLGLLVWSCTTFAWFLIPFKGALNVHEGAYIVQILPFVLIAFAFSRIETGKRVVIVWAAAMVLTLQVMSQVWLMWEYRWKRDYGYIAELGTVISVEGSIGGADYDRTTIRGRVVHGTYGTSDADTASLTIEIADASALRYRTGPNGVGQTLRVVDHSGKILLNTHDETHISWVVKTFPKTSNATLTLHDNGKGSGQWSAVELNAAD